MKITVKRSASDKESTASFVFIDQQFQCFGLEDEHRTEKVWGETRIPAGTYSVELRTEGGFHQRYSKRFRHTHQGMLHIVGVPNFKYVLIHIGNTDDDTAGCLLLGKTLINNGVFVLQNSTMAYADLYNKVWQAAKDGELTIEFIDDDLTTEVTV